MESVSDFIELLRRVGDRLLDWIALGADDHVVELGAATGRFSERILARLGPGGTLTVVDNDPRFVSSLEKFAARDPRVRAVALDPNLESAPPMQADVVIIRNFAHRVERRDLLYPLARASLRPGGRLVVVDFRAARTNPGPPLPDRIPEPYARAAWARPAPDVLNYSYRDYGNRAGFMRMFEAMGRCNMRGSVSLNVAVCEHHPEIIRLCADAGWEFYSHGTYNTRYLMGMTEAQERAVIQDSIDTIRKHTGQKLDGWLAPALTYTDHTLDLVAEMGLTYVCDLFHDDQPGPVKVKQGRLTSVPYSLEMNDVIVYNVNLVSPRRYADILKRQFDRLYAEGEHSGTVMCIPLHPYLVGQPYRMAAFEEALAYITGHEGVWLATGREIAQHFNDNYYDAFAAAAQPVGDAA